MKKNMINKLANKAKLWWYYITPEQKHAIQACIEFACVLISFMVTIWVIYLIGKGGVGL